MNNNPKTFNRTLIHEETRFNGVIPSKIQIYKTFSGIRKGYPLWSFVLLGFLFLILVATLIGALVVYNGKHPAIYQMDCNKRSCAPGFGLKCINSICQCPSNDYYYSTKCELKKSNDEFCNNDGQCKQELICFNGKCSCGQEKYWTGKTCANKVSHSESCERAKCLASLMLVCDPSTKVCTCDTDRFWSGESCVRKRSYKDSCQTSQNCVDNKGLQCLSGYCLCNQTYSFYNSTSLSCENKKNENEACSLTIQCLGDMICLSGNCECSNDITHYFDYTSLTCSLKTFNNTSCSSTRTCRSDLGLSCQSGLCQCSTPLFWYSGQCSNPRSYSQTGCTSDSHCESSLGLICNGYPITPTSSCSITAVSGMCDCPIDKYWDGNQCLSRYSEFQSCSDNCECLNNLICDSCIDRCLNNTVTCSLDGKYYNGKCYKKIGNDDDYANQVSDCISTFSSKSGKIAYIDSLMLMNYLTCHISMSSDGSFIDQSSTVSCSPNSGSCKILKSGGSAGCEMEDCSDSDPDAICEYLP